MAGIRCGVALGRPDLLAKLQPYLQNSMPVTALAAAKASLDDPDLVPTAQEVDQPRGTPHRLASRAGYKPIGVSPQQLLHDRHRPRRPRRDRRPARQKVYIGRIWPVWPNAVRVSVGSRDEMAKFRVAFKAVMDAPAMAASPTPAQHASATPPGMGGTPFLS